METEIDNTIMLFDTFHYFIAQIHDDESEGEFEG